MCTYDSHISEYFFSFLRFRLIDEPTRTAAAIDPVEPDKLLAAANAEGVQITNVLTTHHHWDHAGGNEDMKKALPGVTVYGGSLDKVAGCTHLLQDGEKLRIGQSLDIRAIHTPA